MQRQRKVRWPGSKLLTFPLGLDTFHPQGGEAPITSLQILENAEEVQSGVWQTRRGRTTYLPSLGPNQIMGLYELFKADGTTILLVVYDGKLYKESAGAWVNIPIRKYKPYPPYPDDSATALDSARGENLSGSPLTGTTVRTSGAVGANLVANRRYRYTCHGVDATGTTELAEVTGTMVALTGATPYPIDVTWHGCYGMTSYTVWRSQSTDGGVTWSAWGRMATGVTHTTVGGKTLVQWTDSGNVAPDTGQATPTSNTTEHVLPTTQRVDWETWDGTWDGENATYLMNGDGYCRTDGTRAEIVTPTSPSAYWEEAAGINGLGDITWPGHVARGMVRHHAYLFFGDVMETPNVYYWTRAADPCHAPQTAALEIPASGGRVLDFIVKDAQLASLVNTGVFSMVGRDFTTIPPSTDVYFSKASDKGVASEWSAIRAPNGWVEFLGQDRRLRALAHLQPDEERTSVIEVGEAIRPTLDGLTDHENAVGMWAEDQWFLAFPDDQQMLRIYQRETPQGLLTAPSLDTGTALGALLRLRDGTLIGAHATTGQLYKLLQDGTYTDNGQAYTFKLQTTRLNAGSPGTTKKWRWVRVYYSCQGQVELNYRFETLDGFVEDAITLAGTGGYDEGMYDAATYDPWSAPYEELDFGEEGPEIQVTLWTTGYIRIHGLLFEMDIKR